MKNTIPAGYIHTLDLHTRADLIWCQITGNTEGVEQHHEAAITAASRQAVLDHGTSLQHDVDDALARIHEANQQLSNLDGTWNTLIPPALDKHREATARLAHWRTISHQAGNPRAFYAGWNLRSAVTGRAPHVQQWAAGIINGLRQARLLGTDPAPLPDGLTEAQLTDLAGNYQAPDPTDPHYIQVGSSSSN